MLQVDHARVVALVEACYRPELADTEWVPRLLAVLLGMSQARSAMFMRVRSSYDDCGALHIESVGDLAFVGPDVVAWSELTQRAVLGSPARESTFGKTQGTTFSAASGLGAALSSVPGWRTCWREPIVDALGLVGRDAHGDGFCACVGLTTTHALTQKEARLLTKLATHVGASERLRRRTVHVDHADAVLSAHGKVLHLATGAQHERATLDEGRKRRELAKKTKHDAERALEIWQGLVAGTWSLVDHFDTDGKRLVLAMKNAPEVSPRADLTALERRVSSLATMGHRDKEIAYMLGVTLPSVGAALHRARNKLGVGSRAALAATWRRSS